jgi:hypothetical protein
VAPEPYICDDEVPNVEHGIPPEGIAIVPVGLDGRGLTPAEVISVEPSGIPVGEMDEADDALPSGEVSLIMGVGATIPPICARATLPTSSAGRAAAIGKNLILTLHFMPMNPAGIRRLLRLVFAALQELSASVLWRRCAVHCQTESGRFTTMGVGVLRTTTHRNASVLDGLISMCGRKAGT